MGSYRGTSDQNQEDAADLRSIVSTRRHRVFGAPTPLRIEVVTRLAVATSVEMVDITSFPADFWRKSSGSAVYAFGFIATDTCV